MPNVLITGGGGFIGSHLAERCVDLGFHVKVLVRYNSQNNWGWLESSLVRDAIEIVSGDIRDFDSVKNAMTDCDTVFHLAALIGIPYSYVSPKAYIDTNIVGTYNVLQASKELQLSNILVTSTSETYGSAQYVPIDENHPLVGQSPYSATKIAADQLAMSYHRSFSLPVKIVRPFNTYGPRQSARAVIPSIITQLLAGKDTIKIGNLAPTRDLTFVKDTVDGFIEIFRSDALFGTVTNIGMNDEISIGDLVQLIGEILHVQCTIENDEERIRPSRSEVERLRCNNAKIISTTQWQPKYTLRSGLEDTISFLRNNLDHYKFGLYNI